MRSPEQIHFMPGAVYPVIEKVVQHQRQYPGQRVAGIPFKGAEFVQDHRIHKDIHPGAQRNHKLADRTYIKRGNGVFQTVHLQAAPPCHP